MGSMACSIKEPPPDPEIKTVAANEAARDAQELRESLSVTVAGDMDLSLWASEKLLADPIAIDMDDQGRALITVTNRSRNSEFDIRDVDSRWLTESMIWETVEDRRAFLHTELAPERSSDNTWLTDHNGDGSHDWRDLTVEKEEIHRIEDRSGDGLADFSQLFIRDFHDEVTDVAGAVLSYNDDVFLGVGPDMWRITDTNNDGMGDTKKSISHGYNVHIGFSGHGMSGLTVGPDGRIYWGIGDMGLSITDNEGRKWHHPNNGAILRSEPDGSNFEVFAAGIRNTHEFTFDKYGNLITVDNDGDHAGEFERLVYLINGSDSGWRINWQFGKYTDPKNNGYKVWMDENYFHPRFEDQAAHVLPPLARYHSGPAGMVYNPGTALNEAWKDHFFLMSFRGSSARSSVFAFTLKESGASFELDTDQEVLNGILAVGMDIGPDGALYLADWIEGWGRNQKGRIWKLDTPRDAGSALRLETKDLLAEGFERRNGQELVELLEHSDMRVRQKAQFELAGRGDTALLLSAIVDNDHQLARIHGIWGLGQLARENLDVAEHLPALLGDDDPEIRAQSARMLGDVRYAPARDALISLLGDDRPRARFFAAEALGRIGDARALQPVVDMLEANGDEDVYLRQAGAIALARMDAAESITALADHPSRAVRIAAIVALKRMEHPGAARFLNDDDEYIVTNAARAIGDDVFVWEAIPALARMLEQDRFLNEPLIRRAINAGLYSGTAEDALRLGAFARRADRDEALRVEALNTLATWPEPSIFDRVTGRHRGQIHNDADDARNALDLMITGRLPGETAAVKIAVAEAAGLLGHRDALPAMYALLEQDPNPDVRIAALTALRDGDYGQMDEAIALALKDDGKTVRMSALSMLPKLDLPAEETVDLLVTTLDQGTVEERQTVLTTLGTIPNQAAYRILNEQLDRLIAGRMAAEIQLELIEALEQATDEGLKERLKQYESSKPDDDPVALYRESLRGGDAQNGRRIFFQHASAQCIRCHAVNQRGGDAGPDLSSTGRHSREVLLEALLNPMARLTPGYGTVTLILNDDDVVRGVLQDETASEITVLTSGREQVKVKLADIAERDNSPSAMPPMGGLLSKRELRDVVEYLTTLNGE
ncbi:MAG: HEAT repeat domain-containing protein [Balneolales bacterium]